MGTRTVPHSKGVPQGVHATVPPWEPDVAAADAAGELGPEAAGTELARPEVPDDAGNADDAEESAADGTGAPGLVLGGVAPQPATARTATRTTNCREWLTRIDSLHHAIGPTGSVHPTVDRELGRTGGPWAARRGRPATGHGQRSGFPGQSRTTPSSSSTRKMITRKPRMPIPPP